MPENKVVILMGSKSDADLAKLIGDTLGTFGVKYEFRIASAHKTPGKLMEILKEYEKSDERLVYITVAGRSNALSGTVDANTTYPVIACPPYSDKFAGSDLYSSLRNPSGVASAVVLEPESAALMAIKILAMGDDELSMRYLVHQQGLRDTIGRDDSEIRGKTASEIVGKK